MSDKEEDLDPQFEEETEFVDEKEVPQEDPDETLPEDVKKTSKKDLYARVQAAEKKVSEAPDPTERISKAFETAMGKMQAPVQVVQQPGETDEQFKARFKTDAFDEDKGLDTFNEAIDRRIGPRLAQANELNFKQAERIMELDPDTGGAYKKYKAETQAYIKANFPASLQRDPRVLELAFNQVRVAHVDEIAQDRANTILEAERKKLAEGTRRAPIPLEAGGTGGGGAAPRRKTFVRTAEDYKQADLAGVDVDVIVARRAAKGGK